MMIDDCGEWEYVVNELELKRRTRRFALEIIRACQRLPGNYVAQTLGRQMLRSGTSVGAHYHEACRARSSAEFVSKIEGGLQELEETNYWLQLLEEAGLTEDSELAALMAEADELAAILVASARTAKRR